MFVRYQHVRNGTIGMSGVVLVAIIVYNTCGGDDYGPSESPAPKAVTAAKVKSSGATTTAAPVTEKMSSEVAGLYEQAMRIAHGKAKLKINKDALGGTARWKVDLHDDDGDGTWDRARVDRDRDGAWDETWIRKNKQWEKKGGEWVWAQNVWIKPGSATKVTRKTAPVARGKGAWAPDASAPGRHEYSRAMRIADSRAIGRINRDALGNKSNWKLDLHDADGDGVYEMAQVDYERDGKWDETWLRKNGRWLKGGGAWVWSGKAWLRAANAGNIAATAPQVTSKDPKFKSDKKPAASKPRTESTELAELVRLLLKDKAGAAKYKDAMGYKSTWNVDLFDEDEDGKWDRAKVDKGRDNTWDEEWKRDDDEIERKDLNTGKAWTYAKGKWEKD